MVTVLLPTMMSSAGSADIFWAGSLRGPCAVGGGGGGDFGGAEGDGDGFAGVGGAPDGEEHALLEDHVVGEERIGFNVGTARGGECEGGERGRKDEDACQKNLRQKEGQRVELEPGHLLAFLEPLFEFVEGPGVEDVFGLGPGAAGGEDAVLHHVEVGQPMGVGVDAEGNAGLHGHAGVGVAEVEAVIVGVDFQGDAIAGGGEDDFFHVGFQAAARGDEAAGGVADDADVGVADGFDEAAGWRVRSPWVRAAWGRV